MVIRSIFLKKILHKADFNCSQTSLCYHFSLSTTSYKGPLCNFLNAKILLMKSLLVGTSRRRPQPLRLLAVCFYLDTGSKGEKRLG